MVRILCFYHSDYGFNLLVKEVRYCMPKKKTVKKDKNYMRLASIIGNKHIAMENYIPHSKTFNILVSLCYNVL